MAGTRRDGAAGVSIAVLLGAVLGIGAHSLLPAAGSLLPAGGSPAPVQVAGVSVERAVDPADTAVVRVEVDACGTTRTGSATVVETAGGELVLTNAHVVRGAGTAQVRTGDGTVRSADVVGSVQGRDAAVLRFHDGGPDDDGPGATELGDTGLIVTSPAPGTAAVGDAVTVVGYPEGERDQVDSRVVQRELRSGYGGSAEVLVIDSPAVGGLSGGGVVDPVTGEVVGLVAARDPSTGRTIAYPIGELLGRALGPVPRC